MVGSIRSIDPGNFWVVRVWSLGVIIGRTTDLATGACLVAHCVTFGAIKAWCWSGLVSWQGAGMLAGISSWPSPSICGPLAPSICWPLAAGLSVFWLFAAASGAFGYLGGGPGLVGVGGVSDRVG